MQIVSIRAPAVGSMHLRAAPPRSPARKGPTIAPSIPMRKLRPGEKHCFVQGHAEGLEARSPAVRLALASLLGCCSQEAQHAHSVKTEKARLAAQGHPTLMTAAQVAVAAVVSGSGSGSALLASRRVPAPRAAATSPRSLAGGACGRGRGPHKPRPRAPRGAAPPSPIHPYHSPGPRGPVSRRAHAHRTGAHTGPHTPQ